MIKNYLRKFLNNSHISTIIPFYITSSIFSPNYHRQRLYTPDNDFIDLDWVNPGVTDKPTVILFHGIEGNSSSHYARRIMYHLEQIGWRGVVSHYRGCSGEINLSMRFYHAGETDDFKFVIDTVKKITPNQLFAAGVSLGGNTLLKYLGENNGKDAKLAAAIAISVPFDLYKTSQVLDQGLNKHLYTRYFLDSLLPKMREYTEMFPELTYFKDVNTWQDFNNKYVTQMFAFKDALDYYEKASSIFYLSKITTPTMIIQSANDPMIPKESWPDKLILPPAIRFLGLRHGGHAGFMGNDSNLSRSLLKLPHIMVHYYNKFIPRS